MGETAVVKADDAEKANRRKVINILFASAYLSVAQHVITLQSEFMLVKDMVGGDVSTAARLLANTQGLVGLLGIIANQAGGRFSDSLGRKPMLMLGPLANILFGFLIFRFPKARGVVLPVRVLRMILTTFSSTVMLLPSFSDIASGPELATALTKMMAFVGMGIVSTPLLESVILKRSGGSTRHSYLALSVLGLVHSFMHLFLTPETLQVDKRKSVQSALSVASFNPFGFVRIFTEGSVALQKMVSMTTLQMFLEGKNLSDIVEIWKRDHLKWSIESSRNFVMAYGALNIWAGAQLTPTMLKKMSIRQFTTVTNLLNALGFFMRGAAEKTWVFLLAVPPMLPGVNGASASALRAPITDRADTEGFGKGEFSAWVNNLRGIAGTLAAVLYGNYYAWARKRGIPPGSTFAVAGVVGALLPQLLLQLTKDSEMEPLKADEAPSRSTAGSKAR
mmetsp:Transcript_6599/g.14351  ORF Transcript_6599/g.14351 Transcript_6599/m.14351 type:complete len:449 (-) Transcript_6599:59-1405(-)